MSKTLPYMKSFRRSGRRSLISACGLSEVGTTTNYRYIKNLSSWRGAITVTVSALNKLGSAILGVLIALVAFPFSRTTALRNVRRSAKAASYAIGCLGPAFGIRPDRYW